MHKKYIILFLLIHKVCAEEAKNFLSKLFVRRQTQTQPAEKEINWKAEAEYFNTKVVPAIDTVLNQYKEKMNQNALSTIDIKALESILTYIDIGNQNFLKPRKSAKYELIKAKTNRLRLAVYKYMYFNRNADQKRVINQIGNIKFELNDDIVNNISKIGYEHPYIFKSIEEEKVKNKKTLDMKIERLQGKSKEELKKKTEEYDKKIKTLQGEIQRLEEELNVLKSKEPRVESFIEADDTFANILLKKSARESEKNLFEQKSITLANKTLQITELETFINEANTVNAGIYNEDNSWFLKNFTELIQRRDTLITTFNNQYSTFLNELFPNESKPWKPLLKKVEKLSSDAPAIIDRDNLQILKNKITSKKKELEAAQQSLQQKISQLTTTIANLETEASNAATIAQNENEKAFKAAKKAFDNNQNNILKQIANIEHKINKQQTTKESLSITTEKELSDKTEQLKTAFIESNIDIKEISKFFYENIKNLSVNIEPWFTNLDQIGTTIHMIEQLPKIEWCSLPASMFIPYNEQPKESIVKSIKNFFSKQKTSMSSDNDMCYLTMTTNDLLHVNQYYQATFIVIKDLLGKVELLKNNQELSANHRTIFNEVIIKQLLYKIKLLTNLLYSNYNTFYQKNKESSIQKVPILSLNKDIDVLTNQIASEISHINKKIDNEDKDLVKNIMEELIYLLNKELINTTIDPIQKIQSTDVIEFRKRKESFFNEFTKLNTCIILIDLFNAFQYNWYTQSNDIAAKFETLCKKDVIKKLTIILSKLDSGIHEIIDIQTKKIQNFDTKTQNHDKIEWKKQIELHTSLLHDVYEYLTLYQVCIIPLLKNELFTNIDIIEKVHETTKKIAEQMNTIINTFQDNSMGYIFKPKYGSLIKYCNKLKSLLKPPKEA